MKSIRTQREIDLDRCDCDHIRRHHYEGRGTCEGTAGVYYGAAKRGPGGFTVCRCNRFKLAKRSNPGGKGNAKG